MWRLYLILFAIIAGAIVGKIFSIIYLGDASLL